MSFQATESEFRGRFWIIAAIFTVGFLLYNLDHVNVSVALSRLVLGGHPDENSLAFGHSITAFFALGTGLVTIGALVRSSFTIGTSTANIWSRMGPIAASEIRSI
jgi:hypothetical protein